MVSGIFYSVIEGIIFDSLGAQEIGDHHPSLLNEERDQILGDGLGFMPIGVVRFLLFFLHIFT
jgi:hypothetical protein